MKKKNKRKKKDKNKKGKNLIQKFGGKRKESIYFSKKEKLSLNHLIDFKLLTQLIIKEEKYFRIKNVLIKQKFIK